MHYILFDEELIKEQVEREAEEYLKKEAQFISMFKSCRNDEEFRDKYLMKFREIDESGDYELLRIFWKAANKCRYGLEF